MKKLNVKEKAKKFWEDNKSTIVAVGITGIVAGIWAGRCYKAGFIDGGMTGVRYGFNWLDETFPNESNANKLYLRYVKEHPEEIVTRKGFGKWS